MTLNKLRTKLKKLESLFKELSYLDSLIKNMDKARKEGLESPDEYYNNVKKRMSAIKNELEEKLANV